MRHILSSDSEQWIRPAYPFTTFEVVQVSLQTGDGMLEGDLLLTQGRETLRKLGVLF